MNPSVIYLICFLISLLVVIGIIYVGNNLSASQLLLLTAMVVGNGGYYALAVSKNLEQAVLACKLTYVIGMFVPVLVFFIVTEICAIHLKSWIKALLFYIQVMLYLMACTIGSSTLYYKDVEYHCVNGVAYLTREYGPGHIFYTISMAVYLVAVIVVAAMSMKRKNIVSSKNVDAVIVLEALTIACYALERATNLNVEIVPVADTVTLIFLMWIIMRLHTYSISENHSIINKKLKETGYIVFDKKLKYMGCNDAAAELFPELLEWEVERKIPGSGGGFNTYLRQPLMHHISNEKKNAALDKPFCIKDSYYKCEVSDIIRKKNVVGYYIEINDVTQIWRNNGQN